MGHKIDLIQTAGIKSVDEARMLIECGFTHLGFPHFLPVNKEDTTLEESRKIIGQIKYDCIPVLITYQSLANEIIETLSFLDINHVQLHGKINLTEIKKIKRKRGGIVVIKSIIVKDNNIDELLSKVNSFQEHIDYFITDTFDPITGAEGATGKTHDWSVSRRIVQASKKPVIMAGGLNHRNVAEAIKFVKPTGVDVHTGIEDRDGNKDNIKSKMFVRECS
jgi:phosphoribosylanthranilate isomerase